MASVFVLVRSSNDVVVLMQGDCLFRKNLPEIWRRIKALQSQFSRRRDDTTGSMTGHTLSLALLRILVEEDEA